MSRQNQWIFLDNFRRRIFLKHQLKKKILNSLEKNQKLTLVQKILVSFHKSLVPSQASKNNLSNRCIISGRNKGVLKKTQTSRFFFRKFSNDASLPSLRRYSR